MEESICIRFIGNISLLPKDLQKIFAKITLLTKDNNKLILNFACPYTSRDEISNSINSIVEGVSKNEIEIEDVNENLITNCFYTHASPNPDILIRTSGEVRLSDFLLWQSEFTQIYFTKVLWPELYMWNFLGPLMEYQRFYDTLTKYKIKDKNNEKNSRVHNFLKNLREKEIAQLKLDAYA